jgi:hypothetical protein
MERRSKTRFYNRGSVICSQFNTDKHYDGQLLNFSQRGMCFQSSRSFKPGTAVLIRLDHCPKGNAVRQEEGGMRSMTLARIQWCRDDEEQTICRYRIGVHYF